MDADDAAVDRVWLAFRTMCNALSKSTGIKNRAASMANAQAFMEDPKHRASVHKWRGWGLLLNGLLHVVKDDILAYLGVDSGVGKKRKLKSGANSKPPNLRWWLNMRNEFASAHTAEGPILHLDPNGRECVTQLFEFALQVINHEETNERDANVRRIRGDIERAAWQTIELLLGYRVYCAVLAKKQLQEAMELALAAVDHDAVYHTTFPSPVSGDFVTLVSVIQLVLKHAPYDLHNWLPTLVPFLGKWFGKLNESEVSSSSSSTQTDIAPMLLQVVTDLGRRYFTFVGQQLVENGNPLLQYIKRTFKTTKRQRWRATSAEFLSLYVELFEYHAGSLVLEGDLAPVRLVRDAKAILSIFLEDGLLQNLAVGSHPSTSSASTPSSALSGSTDGPSVALEPDSVSFVVCAADIIFFHDRLLHKAVTNASRSNLNSDTSQLEDSFVPESPSTAKRSVDATMPMAWEQIISDIVSNGQSEESCFASSNTPLSQFREQYMIQAQQQKQARFFQKRQVARMLILSAVLRRHGSFYAEQRIADIVGLMDHLTQMLDTKDIDKRHYLALHMVAQLAVLSVHHTDLTSDLFEDQWIKVWNTVLKQDLPYVNDLSIFAPSDSVGEIVFVVLNWCLSLGLVGRSAIGSASPQLWGFYLPDGSNSSPAYGLATASRSAAPMVFLSTLIQFVQPTAEIAIRSDTVHLSSDSRTIRSQALSSVFDHIQSVMLFEERKPMDASWEKNFAPESALPAIYGTALASFLGITPSPILTATFLCSDLELPLLQILSSSGHSRREVDTGAELDGFGVHFGLQEWGLAWMETTSSFVETAVKRADHPDRFSPLVGLFRQSESTISTVKLTSATHAEWDKSHGFTRIPISEKVVRRGTAGCTHAAASTMTRVGEVIARCGDIRSTGDLNAVEASSTDVVTTCTHILEDFSTKLSSAETDSPKFLCQLNSLMTVGQTLACTYAIAKETSVTEDRRSVLSVLSDVLQKFLAVLADYFSAGTMDHARKSAMTASFVTQILMSFHSFILILQGHSTLRTLKHPCADPLDLQIPAELRPAIRKIIAAVEASLELVVMDGVSGGPSQQHSSRSFSRDELAGLSRSNSTGMLSTTPPTGASWDWDSLISQPRTAASVGASVDLDDDDGTSDATISASKPSFRTSHAIRLQSLWSLRMILLLKKDIGLKAVKKYTLGLAFTPDFLVAVASMLCGVSGCDSLDLLVRILEVAQEDVGRGSQRGGKRVSSAGGVLFISEILSVLTRCAAMHENRKLLHKEEIPELLLTTARKFVDIGRQMASWNELSIARKTESCAVEVFFRLNTDMFGEFVEATMNSLLDIDISVRLSSVQALQTLFYMYPDGGEQVFRDIHEILLRCLPAHAPVVQEGKDQTVVDYISGSIESCMTALATLFICACSSPSVVPGALLVLMDLAGQETGVFSRRAVLKDWLSVTSTWYGYPSIGRLVGDHFGFLWSHHMMAMTGGRSIFESEEQRKHTAHKDRATGRQILDAFPAVFLLKDGNHDPQRADAIEAFSSYVDVILPSAVLYDAATISDADKLFRLVDEFAHILLLSVSIEPTADQDRIQQLLSSCVEEQLITDLFALSFVLHSTPRSEGGGRVQEVGEQMLLMAEEKASTHALSYSHLGHVVMKIARFCVWDVVGNNLRSNVDGSEGGGEQWLRAMKTMKDKYSGFEWARMNVAELLSEFHELLLRTSYHEPLASRAIECFCFFVNEIKGPISELDLENAAVLQHLLLHVLFETVKNVKRRDKQSSHKLAFLVREVCDHLMKKNTDAFGKYLNFVVQEIADILVRSSRDTDTIILDSDDKAHLEWVVFAICNNMASGLGKYLVEVEVVPTGVSACLDKLNSMLSTSTGQTSRESSSDRRKSLESSNQAIGKIADKSCQQAIHQIEQFVQRANRVGERFYQPRTISMVGGDTAENGRDANTTDSAGMSSQLLLVRKQVRILQDAQGRSGVDAEAEEDKKEAAEAQTAVLAKLTRTLFTLSTQYDGSSLVEAGSLLLTIADTLGEIGVWDAHDFELSSGCDGDELSQLYQRHFRRGALREIKATFQIEMYEHLLRFLSSLLFESGADACVSCDVIYEALNSIKNILHLDEGIKALARSKDPELKAFLGPFVQASASNWSLAVPSAASFRGGLTVLSLSRLRMLWQAHETASFEEWICPLTEAMAERCADRVLRACAPLARHRMDLAIFIFPYVIWAILKSARRDSKTAAIVNDSIRVIASSGVIPSDDRVVQLIIHTINFLRETEKAAFVETNGQRLQRASSTVTKASVTTGTTGPATPNRSPNGRNQVSSSTNGLAYSCLVDVDLLDLAEAAVRAKMPFSAMQFVEMWLEAEHGGSLPSLSPSLGLATGSAESDTRVRSILVDAYSMDDDVDGIYGVNDGRSLESQMVTYNREGNFAQVLPLYDVALQFDRAYASSTVEGSLNALHRLGYEYLLHHQLDAIMRKGPNTSAIQEHRFELAWKSLQWEAVELGRGSQGNRLGTGQPAYMHQRTMYNSLKALAHRDYSQLTQITGIAKQQALKNTRTSLFGLENSRESFQALSRLQSIHVVEACAKLSSTSASSSLPELFETWLQRHRAQRNLGFDTVEGLLSLEEVLAMVVDLPERANILSKIYLSLSEMSRLAGRVAISYKAQMKLEQLHKQAQLPVFEEAQWKMERAKLLWSQRETRTAIWVAKHLHADLEKRFDRDDQEKHDVKLRMLFVSSLTTTGKWIASQRSENSQVILQDYLQKAANIVDSMNNTDLKATASDVQDAAKAHLALADYMAEMYQQVAARVASREWLAGKRVAEARQRELAECLAMNEAKQHDNRAHIHALNKEVQYDYEERTKVEASVDHFLSGALRSFGKTLALSARSELAVVFRVLSLWFSNQLKPGVNQVVREIVDSVPSYKFVPLSYQIISRVGSTRPSGSSGRSEGDAGSIFERVLSTIVLKLCEQHPHHALVQLTALKNSGDVEGKGAHEFRINVGDAKSEGAKKYLERLRKGQQRELLESLDVMSNAYIQLALFDTRDYHKLGKKISLSDVKITTLSGNSIPFDHCLRDRSRRSAASGSGRAAMPAVLTSTIAPRPDMDYSGVSRMLSFDPMFSITDSGIHRPKIIYCFGSDGRRFKQLVKGKDDIRQDLVIEQVFDTVNQFLKDDQNTRKRNLRLRTYKVVPLSPIAGVLEWVDNTIPWGSYLVSRVAKRLSAHERYHPQEWKHAECRTYLKNQPDKFAAFQTIQKNFTPVFHHFFLEKFPDAAMWYKRRLAYVQSAAVTSIVGYILGIGDRHSQNILIHEETAELVHIDFGVVFDQGMALFTPETVPFRLTRDLVDGMGVSGVEGVFTRCCEASLQLLRKKSASVVTILEVFVHDPLYRWTLSPLKALRIQEEGTSARTDTNTRTNGSETDDSSHNGPTGVSEAANDAAARALIRVRQKLEGYEDPNGNALSIEGQVKQLISAAQDPRNLCALFPGWAPWL